jgi:hypothetical protein
VSEASEETQVFSAFFAAREEELDGAFPGWRRERTVDVDAAIPLRPPFAHVFAPLPNWWWDRLLDYYLLVVPDDHEAQQLAFDDALTLDERNGAVFRQVLFAGPTAPWVCAVPPPFARASAELSEDRCAAIAAQLARLQYPNDVRLNVSRMVEEDVTGPREMYESFAAGALRNVRDFVRERSETPLWFWGWYD